MIQFGRGAINGPLSCNKENAMEQFRIWEYRLAGCNGIGEFEHGGTATKVTAPS